MTQSLFHTLWGEANQAHSSAIHTSQTNNNFLQEIQPSEPPEGEQELLGLSVPEHLKKYGGFKKGGHNDYNPDLYEHHFKKRLTYAEWKKLPRGVKDQPLSGANAYIISLTSWPPRTNPGTPGIWLVIEGLMRQRTKPDRIILWLSSEEYPYGRYHLPQTLLDLEKRGLEIKFMQGNGHAANKLLPCFANKIAANIITVDDDILYPDHLVTDLKVAHQKTPHAVIGNAGHVILNLKNGVVQSMLKYVSPPHVTYFNPLKKEHSLYVLPGKQLTLSLAAGSRGILYPFDSTGSTFNGLHRDVMNSEYVLKFATRNDDMWFHACRLKANTDLYSAGCDLAFIEDYPYQLIGKNDFLDGALHDENKKLVFFKKGNNLFKTCRYDEDLRKILRHFPEVCKAMGADPLKEHCPAVLCKKFSKRRRFINAVKSFLGFEKHKGEKNRLV